MKIEKLKYFVGYETQCKDCKYDCICKCYEYDIVENINHIVNHSYPFLIYIHYTQDDDKYICKCNIKMLNNCITQSDTISQKILKMFECNGNYFNTIKKITHDNLLTEDFDDKQIIITYVNYLQHFLNTLKYDVHELNMSLLKKTHENNSDVNNDIDSYIDSDSDSDSDSYIDSDSDSDIDSDIDDNRVGNIKKQLYELKNNTKVIINIDANYGDAKIIYNLLMLCHHVPKWLKNQYNWIDGLYDCITFSNAIDLRQNHNSQSSLNVVAETEFLMKYLDWTDMPHFGDHNLVNNSNHIYGNDLSLSSCAVKIEELEIIKSIMMTQVNKMHDIEMCTKLLMSYFDYFTSTYDLKQLSKLITITKLINIYCDVILEQTVTKQNVKKMLISNAVKNAVKLYIDDNNNVLYAKMLSDMKNVRSSGKKYEEYNEVLSEIFELTFFNNKFKTCTSEIKYIHFVPKIITTRGCEKKTFINIVASFFPQEIKIPMQYDTHDLRKYTKKIIQLMMSTFNMTSLKEVEEYIINRLFCKLSDENKYSVIDHIKKMLLDCNRDSVIDHKIRNKSDLCKKLFHIITYTNKDITKNTIEMDNIISIVKVLRLKK
jgi:hypothetical protein